MALGMSEAQANSTGRRAAAKHADENNYGWFEWGNGTNSSGFSGLPGGLFDSILVYAESRVLVEFLDSFSQARYRGLNWYSVLRNNGELHWGFSVRCVRDAE